MNDIEHNVRAYDLLHDESARNAERDWLLKIQKRGWISPLANRDFAPGVSVIIPAHKAVDTIGITIRSLLNQSLPYAHFEVIVVCNGEDDGTSAVLNNIGEAHSEFGLRIFHSDIANAGSARNMGLSLARHEYVTFVDADDEVETNFLSQSLSLADEHLVVASPIVNCTSEGVKEEDNSLNKRIAGAADTTVALEDVPWLLGFNACKLVSTRVLLGLQYRSDLVSGEDLVFFANLLSVPGLQVKFPATGNEAAYIRHLRPDSISRQTESFDFNVRQRVDCIAALRDIRVDDSKLNARNTLENAQLGFVKRYLASRPQDSSKLEEYLAQTGFLDFPWESINAGTARDLAISYCFSPFSDTSAVVAEKAIAERGRVVDVISNDMSKVRKKDHSVSFLAARWIDRHIVVDTPPSFAGWEPISKFGEKAFEEAERLSRQKGGYETLYSRALWVGSHVAAAMFKNRHPEVKWTAEFSDPLRFGVEGQRREGAFTKNAVSDTLFRILVSRGWESLEVETLFDLVEAATMLLADEVVFTNANQADFMLSHYPAPFAQAVRDKSIVRPHPTPPNASYYAVLSKHSVASDRVNIGYFGSFYINRGLGDLFTALINTSAAERRKVAVHIFCNAVEEARTQVRDWGLGDVVSVNPYLPYMEFLNASTKFDVLLVNDVSRGPHLPVNPFLPSKLSDYRGAGARIWGLIDLDSPLSREHIDYKSTVGNSRAIMETLKEIISDHFERSSPSIGVSSTPTSSLT
ncbi:glycosyltransferase [Corynebacterium guangdongense]|uniref:Glycosyltransferase involved in cell wall biosynthesis n=1 Tax=Corynebacterium guangdongense TaxID=1783348 RepID=A0ABU1ZY81_9CORY|nr:glycosyltransferase [Corynebacterium guangdongense]MDR7329886.1 glycosyltransferase involved in cell wall biosynthesis [Corynebacterium guangdongense]WJZ18448.1 Putative glycosyltransferase EpsH [Corynebacterium guangdongense]